MLTESDKEIRVGCPKNFLRGEPWIADENDCSARWSGGKNGKYFRCAICGHKFTPGDRVRCVYSNHTYAHGNPLVCEQCDGSDDHVLEKWKEMYRIAREKFWWFTSDMFDRDI